MGPTVASPSLLLSRCAGLPAHSRSCSPTGLEGSKSCKAAGEADLIAKKHLTVLLQDEIFADFFNTFLNLPVFGQTPIFMGNTRKWYLWPELPCNLASKHKGLMNWMEKYRLPFFYKTNLCLHYLLCEELISFIRSPEAAEMLRWKKADQWLLEKCIAGTRGMWRFRSFLQGMAGEELTKFWLAVERILSIDETEESEQDLYVSLIQVLMATHLQEGSTVVTLCNNTIESLLKAPPYHPPHFSTRREVLGEMQKVALFKIESYWLPNFYIHCRLSMEHEPKCRHLLEEHEERLRRVSLPKASPSPLPPMSIRASSLSCTAYSSLESKRKVWDQVRGRSLSPRGQRKGGRKRKPCRRSPADKGQGPAERRPPSPGPCQAEDNPEASARLLSDESPPHRSSPSESLPSPVADEVVDKCSLSKLRSATPVVQVPSMLGLKTLVKSPSCLDFLPWVLTADKCAGRPFREFLLSRSYSTEVHLLDLWHDLEDFLRMMLCSLGEGNILLRHVMGERICELYLTQSSNWHLPLKLSTLRSLQNLLPSGHVIPWVLKAQKEICKILSFLYEEFLQQDDKMFLYYVSGKEKKPEDELLNEREEVFRLVQRIIESVHLSQTLAGMKDFDPLIGEHWEMLGTQDLRMGGSIYMELRPVTWRLDYSSMAFGELVQLNPKMAVELLSKNFRTFCKKCPSGGVFYRPLVPRRSLHWTRSSLSFMRKGVPSKKALMKPRTLSEVLQTPLHLDYFRHFLKMHYAEALLLFWMAVEELKNEPNSRVQRAQINECVRTFFFNAIPPEKLLQCNADIIKEIPRAYLVTVPMLVTAQTEVMKILEEKWFKMYQGLYPENDLLLVPPGGGRSRRSSTIKEKMKRCWYALAAFVRTVCRFRKAMSYVAHRKLFEEFLHREIKNDKENLPSPGVQNRLSISGPSGRPGLYSGVSEDVEVMQAKRKIFGSRIISVNFLVNDLYFYLEMEKFFHLADSVVVLASLGLYTEKDIAFLKSKVTTINKLFLNSDIPPKLRVNLTDVQCVQIRALIAEGVLNRTLYHGAIVSIFPVLLYFWKRYCHWKVMKGFKRAKVDKVVLSPPVPAARLARKISCFSGEDHPIIRYTILKGIQLFLPQPKEEVEEMPGEKSSVGSLGHYSRKSSTGLCVPQKRASFLDTAKKAS